MKRARKHPKMRVRSFENGIMRATVTTADIANLSDMLALDAPGPAEQALGLVAAHLAYFRKLLGASPADTLARANAIRAAHDPLTANYEAASAMLHAEVLDRMLSSGRAHPAEAAFYAIQLQAAVDRFALVPAARRAALGRKYSASQSMAARHPRGGVVSEIASRLANRRDALGDPLSPLELWNDLLSALEQEGREPVENGHTKAEHMQVEYDGREGKRKTLTMGTWRATLQRARRRLA